jgi:predicted dehydrogenase
MKKTGLGIVGCSGRVSGLLSILPGYNENVFVKAVFDPDKDRAEKFRQGAKCPDAEICPDYEALLARKDIEWVAVTSWNALHASQAAQAMKAGKNVFCEKPLATNMRDAVLLKKTAEAHPELKFLVGFTLRYSPFHRGVKKVLDSGMPGKLISMEFNETLGFNHGGHIMSCWRRLEKFTGSHILEKCCHDIDIANWLTGSRPKRAASFGGLDFFLPENSDLPEKLPRDREGYKAYCQWPTARNGNPFLTDKTIIDNQVVILEYENGVRATFHTNLNAGIPERRFYILGAHGAVRGDMITNKIESAPIGFDAKITETSCAAEAAGGHAGADPVLCKHWANLMSGAETKPLSTVANGLESAVVCFAAEESRKTGRVVNLEKYWRRL